MKITYERGVGFKRVDTDTLDEVLESYLSKPEPDLSRINDPIHRKEAQRLRRRQNEAAASLAPTKGWRQKSYKQRLQNLWDPNRPAKK